MDSSFSYTPGKWQACLPHLLSGSGLSPQATASLGHRRSKNLKSSKDSAESTQQFWVQMFAFNVFITTFHAYIIWIWCHCDPQKQSIISNARFCHPKWCEATIRFCLFYNINILGHSNPCFCCTKILWVLIVKHTACSNMEETGWFWTKAAALQRNACPNCNQENPSCLLLIGDSPCISDGQIYGFQQKSLSRDS